MTDANATGTGVALGPEGRRKEAERLLDLLHDYYDLMERKDQAFWEDMQNYDWCSAEQLRKLGELRARYVR